jgi:DNA-binding MarR family transcriptional regulator
MAKRSDRPGTSAPSPREVAEAVVQATLLVTRLVTPEVRRLRPKRLSLSQIRALDLLDANPDAALMAVADYVGLAPPSTSVLVDGLVRRGLVARLVAPDDRRRLRLRLTGAGRRALRAALAAAQAVLAARLAALSPRERTLLVRAMARLRPFVTRGRNPLPRGG